MNAIANFTRPDSQLAFSAQEQEAYFAANEVNEIPFDVDSLNGICVATCKDTGGKLYHINNAKQWYDGYKVCIIDRRKLGSKSSRRYQVTTLDNEQRVVGLFRDLDKAADCFIAAQYNT